MYQINNIGLTNYNGVCFYSDLKDNLINDIHPQAFQGMIGLQQL